MKNVPIAIYESCTYAYKTKEHSWGFLIFICQDRYMTVSVAFRAICMHEKPRTCFPACQSETVVLNLQSRVRIPSPLPPSFALACIFLITHLVPMNSRENTLM